MTAIQYISQLPAAAAAGATDLIPVTQGSTGALTGTTRKLTVAQLFTSPAFTGTTTVGNNLADYLTVTGAANTGVVDTSSPIIQAAGTATDIDVKVLGKGTGRLNSTKLYVGTAGTPRTLTNSLTVANIRTDVVYSGSIAPAFRVGGNFSGSTASGSNFLTQISMDADTIDAAGRGVTGLFVGHTVSAGAKGGRTTAGSFLNINGAITADASGTGSFLVAGANFAQASASAGGTSGLGNARGNLFGWNGSARLLSGAGLYWNSLVGAEINVGTPTGTQAGYKVGLQIIQWDDDAVAGSQGYDTGLSFAIQATAAAPIGWDVGISFGHPFGQWPVKAAGKLISTQATAFGGLSYAAAYGVDFTAVTFSTAAFASPSFQVDGSGKVRGAQFEVGSGGPRIVQGTGVPPVVLALPRGSFFLRTDGGVGSTVYVSQGGGTWNAIAGV